MAIEPVYRYRAVCTRVIDGDTYEFDIDLGLHVHAHVQVRLRGWSAHEMNTPEGIKAQVAAASILIVPNVPIIIETFKDRQTFGRWIADVYVNAVPLYVLLKDHLHAGSAMGLATQDALRTLFETTGAATIEVHSGDREPGRTIHRKDVW